MVLNLSKLCIIIVGMGAVLAVGDLITREGNGKFPGHPT